MAKGNTVNGWCSATIDTIDNIYIWLPLNRDINYNTLYKIQITKHCQYMYSSRWINTTTVKPGPGGSVEYRE